MVREEPVKPAESPIKIKDELPEIESRRFLRKRDVKDTNGETPSKRPKEEQAKEDKSSTVVCPDKKVKIETCFYCRQPLDQVPIYNGHPNGSTEEFIALTDEKLSVFTGGEESIHEIDQIPTVKVTYFSVYDKEGHLCPFDSGLVECNVRLFFSGYLKPIDEEDSSPDGGIPAHMGPIDEWWMAGFDGGDKLMVGFTTEYGNYYLMDPSADYEPLFQKFRDKNRLFKMVVEFLLENALENPTIEDLISRIRMDGYPDPGELLLQNANFLCNQIVNYDRAKSEEDDDLLLISLPCMRSLVKMGKVTFEKGLKVKSLLSKCVPGRKAKSKVNAVATNLVRNVFEHFFLDIHNIGGNGTPRRRRCGKCESCRSSDCGECSNCKDMLKFGGTGRSKQACKKRRCPEMAIKDAEKEDLLDNEDETELPEKEKKSREKKKSFSKKIIHDISWECPLSGKYLGKKCYSSAKVGEDVLSIGEYVTLKSDTSSETLAVARIVHMYEGFPHHFMFHGHIFQLGHDTVLQTTSDPRELFVTDECVDLPLGSINTKTKVEYRKLPENWSMIGGDMNFDVSEEDGFYYSKRFDWNRFVDIDVKSEIESDECGSCRRQKEKKMFNTPRLYDNVIIWRQEEYKVGTGVFLDPKSYSFENQNQKIKNDMKENEVDHIVYPEYYRKKPEVFDIPDPFVIGTIEDIIEFQKEIKIKIRIFYRTENIPHLSHMSTSSSTHLIYYTEKEIFLPFSDVQGKCYISFGETLEDPFDWVDSGPYRFYFMEMYDTNTKQKTDVPNEARRLYSTSKGKGKLKGKAKFLKDFQDVAPDWIKLEEPLNCMDIFAGCGGLSEGLHQSGVARTKWAIELESDPAKAFSLNNPDCKMFTEDCNILLKCILDGEGEKKGMPVKGEVELLVGGPPCQGFSGMNRFNARECSLNNNSQAVAFLSYCDYYRPKYFMLENVRNFVSFQGGIVLRLTIRCLLEIGYQVTFGVLQAGQYGVPQTRRRFILMASAPGYVLPKLPEPLHVFNKKGLHLTFAGKYDNGCHWVDSAPYRAITVRDAISDLPEIKNGCIKTEMPYDTDPISHFQRKVRGKHGGTIVKDHICKDMSALYEARITYIPTYQGADWRDLPNINVKLRDGTFTSKLVYNYKSAKQKDTEPKRGVCLCSTGAPCDPRDRQFNTLIPWCLPHSGDRNNNWAGLFGRVEWDGYFRTTITDPEPMGKQGRVLHPNQNRVVSVRECARSQGFPDHYKFYGRMEAKHKQVGNAVPPPLGEALGREICRAVQMTNNNKQSNVVSSLT